MIDNRQVGKKIAAMRQGNALTQQQLAAMMNVSHQAVSKWESGQALPDIQTMLELTRFFGITVEQLVSDQELKMENDEETHAYAGGEMNDTNVDAEPSQQAKEVQKMNIQQLLQMAPYMSKETVEEIVMEIDTGLSAAQIARIAPYVRAECVEKLIEKHRPELSWDTLRRIAPYMRRESVDELARAIASGKETVKPANDNINKTINDIGKAFDDIGRGVGKAVKKAIRFGESVIDEVSSAFSDAAVEVQSEEKANMRSERVRALRKKAFERALEYEKWDWLAEHIEEIEADEELKARIAQRAREKSMHDWICENLGAYADEHAVESAIEKENWDWLGKNICRMDPRMQEKAALAAAKAGNWKWLREHSDGLMLTQCAVEIAKVAHEKGEKDLLVQLAENHMLAEELSQTAALLLDASDLETLDRISELLNDDFLDGMLTGMADSGEWKNVERYIDRAAPETVEKIMELAVDQGNFEAVDMLDDYLE